MFTVAPECGGRFRATTGPGGAGDSAFEQTDPAPGDQELVALAEGLAARALSWPGLVGLTTRRFELLQSAETFEAWVIGWPPGGTIELHDHGDSAGAVAVAGGELVETLVSERDDGTVSTTRRPMLAGMSWVMGRRHIHDVVNHSHLPAVSVHVYAPRLTSMTHYRIVDGRLRPENTIHYQLGHVVP